MKKNDISPKRKYFKIDFDTWSEMCQNIQELAHNDIPSCNYHDTQAECEMVSRLAQIEGFVRHLNESIKSQRVHLDWEPR